MKSWPDWRHELQISHAESNLPSKVCMGCMEIKTKPQLSDNSSSGWKSRTMFLTLITFFCEEDEMKCIGIMDELGLERVFAVTRGSASAINAGASAGSRLTNADFYREL